MNIDYSQFYRGTTNIPSYGNGTYKKDTLVKYEFNTTDEHGNKIMDKMSREETLQAMKDIGSQYGDAVIVEFSGDGMAALVENKKGIVDANVTQEQRESMEARNAAFQKEITQDDNSLELPAYSGMYGADKAVASAVENCSKEEQGFVYDIIRQNFLVGNTGSMTEEERQANISLGMKKAEYAAENFIPEDSRKSFLEAMESIAKLASAGKADNNGNMDYGVGKGTYLGHGSNLVKTTNALDMMRTMDGSAYTEYQKISKESSNEDRQLNALKYLTNWYEGAVKKNPSMVDNYEKQSEEYVEKNVKDQKLDATFSDIKTENKAAFFESLKVFQNNNPNFLSSIINREPGGLRQNSMLRTHANRLRFRDLLQLKIPNGRRYRIFRFLLRKAGVSILTEWGRLFVSSLYFEIPNGYLRIRFSRH